MKNKPTAIRGVIAQTDLKPPTMRAFCFFPRGSNAAQADNFCNGNDAFEDDEDEEEDEKKEKDKDKKKDKDEDDKEKKKDIKKDKCEFLLQPTSGVAVKLSFASLYG